MYVPVIFPKCTVELSSMPFQVRATDKVQQQTTNQMDQKSFKRISSFYQSDKRQNSYTKVYDWLFHDIQSLTHQWSKLIQFPL